MASASTIPPSHVGTHSFQHDAGQPDPMEFPQLRPDVGDDWEMVPETPAAPLPQVKFALPSAHNDKNHHHYHKENPKMLLHSQSSPNLRDYTIEESDSDSEFEHVSQTAAASQDDASSNFSLVSGPPSVNSIWSSRISFKDALMMKDEVPSSIPENSESTPPIKKQHGHVIKKVKPKFIVQQVAPLKHAKSMSDLSLLEEEILGDTDAHEYYAVKSKGSLGRYNGGKKRPDEAKRLQMTMNKKNLQRAQQGL